MMVLVSYDVAQNEGGNRRLRAEAKICKNYGQRVQNSIFECLVTPDQWVILKDNLEKAINFKFDSLRYYYLGANWEKRVEHVGAKPTYNPEGPLIL